MKSVDSAARKTLDALTEWVFEVGDHRKIDNTEGAYMAVRVECIGRVGEGTLISIAHCFMQNGDLMRDPDVVFYKQNAFNERFPAEYYPVSFEQSALGIYREAVLFGGGAVESVIPKLQHDIVSFCDDWIKNIKIQQRI